jgi:hypothetical protein
VGSFYSWAKVSSRVEFDMEPRFFEERDNELTSFRVLRFKQKVPSGEHNLVGSWGFDLLVA